MKANPEQQPESDVSAGPVAEDPATESRTDKDKTGAGDLAKEEEVANADEAVSHSKPESGTDGPWADKDTVTDASPVIAPAKSGSSFGSLLLSGVLGGVIALGGAGALNSAGILQSVPVVGGLFGGANTAPAIEDTNARIAEISTRLDALSAPDGSAIAVLAERVDAAEARLADSRTGASGETINLANQALTAAEAASQKAEETAARIDELSAGIVNSASGGTVDIEAVKLALSGETQALGERIKAMEEQLTTGSDAEAMTAISADLDAIKLQVTNLASIAENVTSIEDRTTGIDQMVTSLSDRLVALEASVNENILPSMSEVEKAAIAAIESQRVARSVSARALGAALEQGGRFTSELASAAALIGESEAIANLRSLADSGVLTETDLRGRFDAVAVEIMSAEAGNAAGDGILDQFMASARSLVQVRPAGPVEGDSTGAILSRIEANLANSDLAGARTEWSALDEAAKSASQDWADALDERIRAGKLIETVIGELSTDQNGQG